MILTLLLILSLSLGYKYFLKPYLLYRKYRKYGNGYFFPLLGDSVELYQNIHKYGDCEYSYKHLFDNSNKSRIYVGNSGSSVKVRLVDAELIKDFFQKSENYELDDFFTANLHRFFGKGFDEKDPKMHRNLRKIFAPAFNFEYLQNVSSSVEEITYKVFEDFIKNNDLKKVNPILITNEITSSVLFLSFFGETLHELRFRDMKLPEALAHILYCLCQQMEELGFFVFGTKYLEKGYFKKHREIEEFQQAFKKYLFNVLFERVEKYKQEYQQSGDIKQHCILSILIKNKHIGDITEEKLLEYFLSFFLAGMETTSNLVGMALYYIAKNKDIYQTLQQEIDSNKDQTSQGLFNLPFLNATIKETLRYYGPGNFIFDRKAIKDHYIGDIKIEKGVVLNVFMLSVHRDPQYYQDPHVYNPSRWLEPKENKSVHPFSFVPFGSGPRQCIGQHLGLMEARIMLNCFVKKFEFEVDKDYNLYMDMKFSPQPLYPLQINLKIR